MDKVGKPNKIWRVILAVSLALNIAVIGAVAGMMIKGNDTRPPARMSFGIGPVSDILNREDRRAIGEQLRRTLPARTMDRATTRAMMDELAIVLTTVPFDPDALQQLMAQRNARSEVVVMAAQDAFVARIAQMTNAERKAVADRIQNGRKR